MRVLTAPSSHEPLRWTDVPDRALRSDEVRVAVRAVGVNPVDWKMRDGELLGLLQKIVGPRGPLVCGVDFAGEVRAVGDAVRDVRVGDRVVGGTDFSRRQYGSYASEVQVRADQVAQVPANVDLVEAACLPVAGVTAHSALVVHGRIDQKREARALILGASGGVGHFAVQLAKFFGARAVGVCSTANLDLVRRLGAEAIDYRQGDALEAARAFGPFDVIVDAVGSSHYPAAKCRTLLRGGGVHVLVMPYGASDYLRIALPGPTQTVLGRPNRKTLTPLVAELAAHRLEVVIQERIPFDEAERAHALSRGGKVVGKLVLVT